MRKMIHEMRNGAMAVAAALVLAATATASAAPYRSVYDVAYAPDGKTLAASDTTGKAVVFLDGAGKKVLGEVGGLQGEPSGIAFSPDGEKLYVAELAAGTVAEIDVKGRKVSRRIDAGPRVAAVGLAPKHGLLLACNSGLNALELIDLKSGKSKSKVPAVGEPRCVAVSPDQSLAVVGNLMPFGDSSQATHSTTVTLVDLKDGKKIKDIKLPSGCAMLRGVIVSPDGKWAYAAHTLGRFTLPTTQLDRGWVNTNAMSVIDLQKKEHYATLLLDRLTEGAADPWGMAISSDGKTLYITLSGVHQLAKVDLEKLHLLMDGKDLPKEEPKPGRPPRHISAIWKEIKKDPSKRDLLANDLAALYGAGLLIRTKLDCNGPRGVALSPDGKRVAIGTYFTGTVLTVDAETHKTLATTPVGTQPQADSRRRGEMLFHDATYCFQHWLSCATCHPDGRADGLNWDLLNDGIGNPKNSKSLLLSHKTPPVMSRGVRSTYEVATVAGFRFILFREPEPEVVEDVKTYLREMTPAPSPYLVEGKLSAEAREGKKIFEDSKVGCARCHPAGLFTDLKTYNVGTRGELDRTDEFDTPTLIEMWRSAPYLHDGSARTLHEVLTTRNKGDKHGKTSHLSKKQIDALVAYLLSL